MFEYLVAWSLHMFVMECIGRSASHVPPQLTNQHMDHAKNIIVTMGAFMLEKIILT